MGHIEAKAQASPKLGKVVDNYLVNVDGQGVILHGMDPVLLRQGTAAKGLLAIQTKYHGAIYTFANEENKKLFLATPEVYEPEFGGYCAYGVSVTHLSPIEEWTLDTTFQNRNIFNHNQNVVKRWQQDIPLNYTKALKEWEVLKKQYLKPKN
jgi:YHS domain-containing protein